MKNKHCRTWFVARKLTNVEKEKQTHYDLGYGNKTDQQGQRKTHIVGLEYGEKTNKRGK
jgi:hypothetical protein